MKNLGIIRKIDELGRVVIPKELIKSMRLKAGDGLQIHADSEQIIFIPNRIACVICGEKEEHLLVKLKDSCLCTNCAKQAIKERVSGI